MNTTLFLLALLLAVPMLLWPVVWGVALIRRALQRRWREAGQVALLLPLWSVAASIAALQHPRLMAAIDAAQPSPKLVVAATSIGVAVCFAVVAWLLLIKSFAADPRQASGSAGVAAHPRPD